MKKLTLLSFLLFASTTLTAFAGDIEIGNSSFKKLDQLARNEIIKSYSAEGVTLNNSAIDEKADQVIINPSTVNSLKVSLGYNIDYARDDIDGMTDYCFINFEVSSHFKDRPQVISVDCGSRD